MRVGIVLKKWRLLSDLDLRQAAAQIGIAHSTLGRLEEGKLPPHGDTVVKLLNWLFTEEPEFPVTDALRSAIAETRRLDGSAGQEPSNEVDAPKGE